MKLNSRARSASSPAGSQAGVSAALAVELASELASELPSELAVGPVFERAPGSEALFAGPGLSQGQRRSSAWRMTGTPAARRRLA
jgi:hypothetical protein